MKHNVGFPNKRHGPHSYTNNIHYHIECTFFHLGYKENNLVVAVCSRIHSCPSSP